MCHEAQLQPLMDHAATAAGPVKSFWVPFPNARTYSTVCRFVLALPFFTSQKSAPRPHCTGVSTKPHNRNKYRESATMRTEISGRRTIQYAFAILPIRPRAQRRRTVCLYKYGCRWFSLRPQCVWRGRASRSGAQLAARHLFVMADLEFNRHPDLIRDPPRSWLPPNSSESIFPFRHTRCFPRRPLSSRPHPWSLRPCIFAIFDRIQKKKKKKTAAAMTACALPVSVPPGPT